jgi:dTDP-4-dehydrorhamnose reductase
MGSSGTVLVTGASGRLGRLVAEEFNSSGYRVAACARARLDVTDRKAVLAAAAALRPAVIVNCAAYNAVDAAERSPLDAFAVNAVAPHHLREAAEICDAVLVHYSSDFVFDGETDRPYFEEDQPNPRSVYATSKLAGEQLATRSPRHYVLRLSSLFGSVNGTEERPSTIDWIAEAIRAGRDVNVFADRTVSPSYAPDVARVTRLLVETAAPAGIYHCVSSGHCTWLELAAEVARQLGRTAALVPTLTSEVRLDAPRPRFCALSNAKLAALDISLPSWQEAIAAHLRHRAGAGELARTPHVSSGRT